MSYYDFTPMTDEEINSYGLVEDGTYDFAVTKSQRKLSKSGNPMAALTITIWDKEGKPHTVFDFLVFSQIPLNIKKVSHFCKAVGLAKEYKSGRIPEELDSLGGKLVIGTQDEMPKDGGGFYPKKNIVVDYLPSTEKPKVAPSQVDEFSDDIPF